MIIGYFVITAFLGIYIGLVVYVFNMAKKYDAETREQPAKQADLFTKEVKNE